MLYFLFASETGYYLNHLGVVGYFWLKDNALVFPIMLSLLAISAFVAYLLGSVNTAVIVSKLFYHDDVREHGSGNAGFTNMMRNYGKKPAIITFVGDFVKTALAMMIGWFLYGYMGAMTAALFAFLGHIFPIFYKFRGGKGIVCLCATIFMLDWRLFLILLAIFVVAVLVTQYISFGSVLCAMILPLFVSKMYKIGTPENARLRAFAVIIAMLFTIIIVLKHLGNLKRIFNGTESKFSFKKSKKTDAEEESEEK